RRRAERAAGSGRQEIRVVVTREKGGGEGSRSRGLSHPHHDGSRREPLLLDARSDRLCAREVNAMAKAKSSSKKAATKNLKVSASAAKRVKGGRIKYIK